MATVIERLAVSVTANYKGLTKGLRASQRQVEAFGRNMEKAGRRLFVAGTAMAAPIIAATREYVRFGDTIDKMAIRTGFATETLSELSFAADITGADISALEKSTRRMSKAILDANDGMTTYVRAFKRIGLSSKDLAKLSPEEAFFAIGNAIASMEDPLVRAAAAQDIFGRAGTSLIPLFEQGADGLAKLRQEARNLGISMTELAARRAAEVNDSFTRMKFAMRGLAISIGTQLAPTILAAAEKFKKFVGGMREFIDRNQRIILAYTKLAIGIMAVGAALLLVAGVAKVVAILLSPVGVMAVAAAGVLLLLDAVGQVNLGWVDFVNSIRIGGIQIGTYMNAVAIWMSQGLNVATAQMKKDWSTFLTVITGPDAKLTLSSFFEGMARIALDNILQIVKLAIRAYEKVAGLVGADGQAVKARKLANEIQNIQEENWRRHYEDREDQAIGLVKKVAGIEADLIEKNSALRGALNDAFAADIRQSGEKSASWLKGLLGGLDVGGGLSVPEVGAASFQTPAALEQGSAGAFSAVTQTDYRQRNAQLAELQKQTAGQDKTNSLLENIKASLSLGGFGDLDVGGID